MEMMVFFGSFYFWALMILCVYAIMRDVVAEKWSFYGLCGVMCGGVLIFSLSNLYGTVSISDIFVNNLIILYLYLPLYIIMGTAYAVLRFIFLIKHKAFQYKNERAEWLSRRLPSAKVTLDTTVPTELRDSWMTHETAVREHTTVDNRQRIITWIIYWPFSIIWFVISQLYRFLHRILVNGFQEAIDRTYEKAGYRDDVNPEAKESNMQCSVDVVVRLLKYKLNTDGVPFEKITAEENTIMIHIHKNVDKDTYLDVNKDTYVSLGPTYRGFDLKIIQG
jgi:hypothetical protein